MLQPTYMQDPVFIKTLASKHLASIEYRHLFETRNFLGVLL